MSPVGRSGNKNIKIGKGYFVLYFLHNKCGYGVSHLDALYFSMVIDSYGKLKSSWCFVLQIQCHIIHPRTPLVIAHIHDYIHVTTTISGPLTPYLSKKP